MDNTRGASGEAAPSARAKQRTRLCLVVGLLLAAGIFIWLIRGIAGNWDQLSAQLSQASAWMICVAVLLQLFFMLCVGLCYHNSLLLAGARIRGVHSVAVYLASQLGKYLPGKVLYVAGEIGLARWFGVPLAQSVVGFMAHHIQLLAMGLLVASPLLGLVLSKKLVVVIVVVGATGFAFLVSGAWVKPFNALQRKRRKPELETFSPVYTVRALVSAGLAWATYGAIACVLTLALTPGLSIGELVRIAMASVAGWVLGFLSFITPSGVGVREGAFVLLSLSVVPEPIAMAVALLMRLIITVAQVLFGLLVVSYVVRGRQENEKGFG